MDPRSEFKSQDYNVVNITIPPGGDDISAALYIQTGRFFGLAPTSNNIIQLFIQFGDGSPDRSKALRVQPGDVYKFQDRFTRFFVWTEKGTYNDGGDFSILVGNKEIDFNPSPQILRQIVQGPNVNLEVSSPGLTFDQKMADIAFFTQAGFVPKNPLSKMQPLYIKTTPEQDPPVNYLNNTTGNSSEYIKTGKSQKYGKNLRFSAYLAAPFETEQNQLINLTQWSRGCLVVLIADFICNPTLITAALKWTRLGNAIDDAAPSLLRVTPYNANLTTRAIVQATTDTENLNETFKVEGIDSYSPVGQSELNVLALETLNPTNTNIFETGLSGHMGRSSKSFIFFINNLPPTVPLQNSRDVLTIEICLSWISAYNDSSADNARRSQLLGDLNLQGWIANNGWLSERLGGWL